MVTPRVATMPASNLILGATQLEKRQGMERAALKRRSGLFWPASCP